MRFEFDREKDDANRDKQGVSLSFGARLFEDPDCHLIPTFREEDGEDRYKDGEDRYKVIGIVDGKFWTAVRVRHGDTVRFISVRRRWRRKAVSCLKPTRATLKIFRPTVRRWTAPAWGGGSGVCGTASASPRRALPGDTASR
jgi:uncharacterized DUF497 family protein